MNILFTKGRSPLSFLITRLTGEPVSHCALEQSGLVLHSNLTGVHLVPLDIFTKTCAIKFSVHVKDETDLSTLAVHASYDYGGLLYLGARYMLKRLFKIRLPRKNLWQITGMYTCVEFVSKSLTGKEQDMLTPYGLYLELREIEKLDNGPIGI